MRTPKTLPDVPTEVRAGKGRKDRVAFIGPTTTRAIKTWLARHPAPSPEAFLFTDREGRPLKYRHLVQTLQWLSAKTGLPNHRRLLSRPAALLLGLLESFSTALRMLRRQASSAAFAFRPRGIC